MTQQQAVKRNPYQDLRTYLELPERMGELATLAPKAWDIKRLFGLVVHRATQDQKLIKCSATSVYQALKDACALGLEPCSPLQEAAIVAYWNGRKNVFEAKFQPMYRGLIAAARRTGVIKDAGAYVVYDGDVIDVDYGRLDMIHHKPLLTRQHNKRVAVWSKFLLSDGTVHYDPPILASEMERIKTRIVNRNGGAEKYNGPWNTDEDEMWKKTSIKRGLKLCQATQGEYVEKLMRAITIDDEDDEEVEPPPTITVEATDKTFSDAPPEEPQQQTTAAKAKQRIQKARAERADKKPPVQEPAAKAAVPAADEPAEDVEAEVVIEEDVQSEPAPTPPPSTQAEDQPADRVTAAKKLLVGLDLLPKEALATRTKALFDLLSDGEKKEALRDSMLESYGDLSKAAPAKYRELSKNCAKILEGE